LQHAAPIAAAAIKTLAPASMNGHRAAFGAVPTASGARSSSQSSSRRTSRIDWNRSSGFFTRQAATRRLIAGDRRESGSAIGSGWRSRIAAITLACVGASKARRPVSIS